MTYREKEIQLLNAVDITWKFLLDGGHWEQNKHPEIERYRERWNKASSDYLDFSSKYNRNTVRMHDEMTNK